MAAGKGKEPEVASPLTPLDVRDLESSPSIQGKRRPSHSDDDPLTSIDPQALHQEMVDSLVKENDILLKEQDELAPKFQKLEEELAAAAKGRDEIRRAHEGIKSRLLEQRERIHLLAALLGVDTPSIHPEAGNVPLTAAPAAVAAGAAAGKSRKDGRLPVPPADLVGQGPSALEESDSSSDEEELMPPPRRALQVEWGVPKLRPDASRPTPVQGVRVTNPNSQRASQTPGRSQQSPGRRPVTRTEGRGSTPGATQYQDTVLRKYTTMIWERTAMPRDQLIEIKGLKVDPPEPFDGKDDLAVWERWLDGLLSYFYFYRVVGPELDGQRVLLTGTRLTGVAATWFAQEVTGPSRATRTWAFEELICSLFRRFLTEVTAQKAVEAFEAVKYTRAKGALGFWNDIVQASERMVNPPDEGTLKRKFLAGLPHEMVDATLKSRPINIELATPDELIEAIRQMEATLHYLGSRRRAEGGNGSLPSSSRTAHPIPSGPSRGNRLVRLRPWKPTERQSVDSRPVGNSNAVTKDGGRAHAGVNPSGALPDKSKVTCYKCGKLGHYANDCKTVVTAGKPQQKARNYALQVDDDTVDTEEAPVDEPAPEADPGGEYDDAVENLDGDQYDPEDTYVLEELEEVPPESEEQAPERAGAVFVDDDEEESFRAIQPVMTLKSDELPYRARTISRRVEERPEVPKEERQCLAAYMKINGVDAYALFDTGSSADMMSPDFARVSEAGTFLLAKQVPLQLGCVGSRSSISRGARVSGQLGPLQVEDIYFDIVNVDRYDVILGVRFMYAQDIILCVRAREILIGGSQGLRIKAMTPEEEMAALAEKRRGQGVAVANRPVGITASATRPRALKARAPITSP